MDFIKNLTFCESSFNKKKSMHHKRFYGNSLWKFEFLLGFPIHMHISICIVCFPFNVTSVRFNLREFVYKSCHIQTIVFATRSWHKTKPSMELVLGNSCTLISQYELRFIWILNIVLIIMAESIGMTIPNLAHFEGIQRWIDWQKNHWQAYRPHEYQPNVCRNQSKSPTNITHVTTWLSHDTTFGE